MSKLAFKCHDKKQGPTRWIIDNFPENYTEYNYLEPSCRVATILLNKERSGVEAINDADLGLVQILRALRDEPREFLGRLAHVKHCEETFKRQLRRSKMPFDDYLDQALNEFVLKRMSRSGDCATYSRESLESWKKNLHHLSLVSERLQNVYVFNRPPIEVVRSYNDEKTLLYCDLAEIEDHNLFAKIMKTFQGKVVLSDYSNTLTNKLYKEWKCCRLKDKTKNGKPLCLWKNF